MDTLLLSGLANKGEDIESIKFTKHPSYTLKYYQKIIGGFKNIKPSIQLQAYDEEGLYAECFFTYIKHDEHIDNVYYIQNIMNWYGSTQLCCQVWKLKQTSLQEINDYWIK